MAVWVTRGGLYEEKALENGKISIGYDITRDLTGSQTNNDVRKRFQLDYPYLHNRKIGRITDQAWSFKSNIRIGGLIVMPRRDQPTIAIGVTAGE